MPVGLFSWATVIAPCTERMDCFLCWQWSFFVFYYLSYCLSSAIVFVLSPVFEIGPLPSWHNSYLRWCEGFSKVFISVLERKKKKKSNTLRAVLYSPLSLIILLFIHCTFLSFYFLHSYKYTYLWSTHHHGIQVHFSLLKGLCDVIARNSRGLDMMTQVPTSLMFL